VLIVEDDPDIRESLSEILAARGFRSSAACNGQDALDMLARTASRPDVIVLDLMMPVMDGIEFLRHQAIDPHLAHVPVIILTAHDPRDLDEAAQVRRVLRKPASLQHLLDAIREVCA
jgi:CheY-like chemotaxis protein